MKRLLIYLTLVLCSGLLSGCGGGGGGGGGSSGAGSTKCVWDDADSKWDNCKWGT